VDRAFFRDLQNFIELFVRKISLYYHLFLDDVYSTGGTLEAVCSALLEIGVELVDVIVVLRRGPLTSSALPIDVQHLVHIDVVDGEVVIHDD
jgi:adenine phosphoribosyltransferase